MRLQKSLSDRGRAARCVHWRVAMYIIVESFAAKYGTRTEAGHQRYERAARRPCSILWTTRLVGLIAETDSDSDEHIEFNSVLHRGPVVSLLVN